MHTVVPAGAGVRDGLLAAPVVQLPAGGSVGDTCCTERRSSAGRPRLVVAREPSSREGRPAADAPGDRRRQNRHLRR